MAGISNANAHAKEYKLKELYEAQAKGFEALTDDWLPAYHPDYLAKQEGLKKYFLSIYVASYEIIDFAYQAWQNLASSVNNLFNSLGAFVYEHAKTPIDSLTRNVAPLVDYVMPINPMNGRRHLVLISKNIENIIGDFFYREAIAEHEPTLLQRLFTKLFDIPQGANKNLIERVNTVFKHITEMNKQILSENGDKVDFNYQIEIICSKKMNAFAVMGGGMVIFSQLIQEIAESIESKAIRNSTVTFADGSKLDVDLSEIQVEDVFAALIGHEMTHVAARHSVTAMFKSAVTTIFLFTVRLAGVAFMKGRDKEYQELKEKEENKQLSHQEELRLREKEKHYNTVDSFLQKGSDFIKQFNGLHGSRRDEFEADITGAFLTEKTGYNPLGALYLQEFLEKNEGVFGNFCQKHFEWLYSHPSFEKRKRALFAAIHEMNRFQLDRRVSVVEDCSEKYDLQRSSSAKRYVDALRRQEGSLIPRPSAPTDPNAGVS